MNKVNFPQAIDGYFLFARARHLSEYTIKDYRNTFKVIAHVESYKVVPRDI